MANQVGTSHVMGLFLAAVIGFATSCNSGQTTSPAQPSVNASLPSRRGPRVRSLTDPKFERTPERLVRGKYLANGIGECIACHGPYEVNVPGWPPVRGEKGPASKIFHRKRLEWWPPTLHRIAKRELATGPMICWLAPFAKESDTTDACYTRQSCPTSSIDRCRMKI